ncbi:hypothetical protein D6817_03715 [Candidatus Pacearchaeota archaeon]|nr:MAG: hypothetical protein D6817_03715 [Candidatus Pacearchaeota archaeon]
MRSHEIDAVLALAVLFSILFTNSKSLAIVLSSILALHAISHVGNWCKCNQSAARRAAKRKKR